MVYRRQEWIVTMSHLWRVVSRNMFLCLNLVFNLVSEGNNEFNCSSFIRFRSYDEMVCSKIILHQHIQNFQEWYSIFYSWLANLPVFPVFSVGRNEHKFVIYLRVKVFTCNILIEYSKKNRNFIFSGLSFRPTFLSDILFSCSNQM